VHVLCLNSRNVLLRQVRVAEGSVDQCHVDPREALAPAIACRATGIVLVHNHPSGDPEPSVNDVALTRQLREAGRLLCIRLLDHLVIGDRGYVSMLSRGLLRGDDSAFVSKLQSP
jgi:DNA repair protein RadC